MWGKPKVHPVLTRELNAVRDRIQKRLDKVTAEMEADHTGDWIRASQDFNEFLRTVTGEARWTPESMARIEAIDKRMKAAGEAIKRQDWCKLMDERFELEAALRDFNATVAFNIDQVAVALEPRPVKIAQPTPPATAVRREG